MSSNVVNYINNVATNNDEAAHIMYPHGALPSLKETRSLHQNYSKYLECMRGPSTTSALWPLVPFDGEKPHDHARKPQNPQNHTTHLHYGLSCHSMGKNPTTTPTNPKIPKNHTTHLHYGLSYCCCCRSTSLPPPDS